MTSTGASRPYSIVGAVISNGVTSIGLLIGPPPRSPAAAGR
jgi:hypothetical protein